MGIAEKKRRLKRLLKAAESGRLALESITKQWYCYKLNITELIWARNFACGWEIDVEHLEHGWVGRIHIDSGQIKLEVN